jgi:hypothetical protein
VVDAIELAESAPISTLGSFDQLFQGTFLAFLDAARALISLPIGGEPKDVRRILGKRWFGHSLSIGNGREKMS